MASIDARSTKVSRDDNARLLCSSSSKYDEEDCGDSAKNQGSSLKSLFPGSDAS